MSEKYYIGIDGGGTKTKCVLTDENLIPVYECTGGPSNFLIIGTDAVSETIYNLVKSCIKNTGITIDKIQGILIGTTGAGRESDAKKLENAFYEYTSAGSIKVPLFRVESDARIALEAAFGGEPGSILIAGTGSIMFGKDRNGNLIRVGGFGRLIGDEGSGNYLGKCALEAVAKAYDGRGEYTMLVDIIRDEFNINNSAELITEVYSNNFECSKLSPFVVNSAAKGDKICINIVTRNVEELLLHIKSMYKKLNENILRLTLIGSAVTTENYYASQFKEAIQNYFPNVRIEEGLYPPEIGAVIMLKQILNKSE